MFFFFFFSYFSSTTFASTSMSTSALPTLCQTRQLPHAVGTAGHQLEGSDRTGQCWTANSGFRPGWARQDLGPRSKCIRLGPYVLNEHGGPQRPNRMREDMPLERQTESQKK